MGVTSFLGEAFRTGTSLVKGLGVTFRELVFEQPITVQYPTERDNVPAWFRGIPVMKSDLTTGEYNCTSCGLCVEACPVNVITLEWHTDPATKKKVADRYAIDMSRCMLCNYCIEACPFDALVMAYDYELCKVNPENLVFEFEDLLRIGLKYSKAVEPEGKVKPRTMSRPPWVFHELTGSTEKDIMDPNGYLGRHPLDAKSRKQYIGDVWAKYGPQAAEHAEAAELRTAESTAQAAAHTITRDTPVQTPVANANPQTVSAAAGPAKIASPKANTAAPAEATEVRPDQNQPSTTAEGGEGSKS